MRRPCFVENLLATVYEQSGGVGRVVLGVLAARASASSRIDREEEEPVEERVVERIVEDTELSESKDKSGTLSMSPGSRFRLSQWGREEMPPSRPSLCA